MERPITVRAGIGAFVASLLVGIISLIVSFADFDALVARAAAAATDPAVTEAAIRAGLQIGLVLTVVVVALQVLFLWFAWKGHNWARIVLWVLGGLGVAFGLAGLGSDTGQTGFTTSMGVFQLLFTAVGIVLLALKPSNDWYRFRRWQRATGQR
jgi:hypothetical protein